MKRPHESPLCRCDGCRRHDAKVGDYYFLEYGVADVAAQLPTAWPEEQIAEFRKKYDEAMGLCNPHLSDNALQEIAKAPFSPRLAEYVLTLDERLVPADSAASMRVLADIEETRFWVTQVPPMSPPADEGASLNEETFRTLMKLMGIDEPESG